MPLKFVTRDFRGNSYYHVYHQGVGRTQIFLDKGDYEMFLYYLYVYTATPAEVAGRYPDLPVRLLSKNLSGEIKLVAYCLMPDHFHLLVKQQSTKALPKLLKQLGNAYTTFLNAKYRRVGGVFQGRYRAILVESEFLVIQMVRFIHLDPVVAGFSTDPRSYAWSSINDHSKSNELLGRFGSVAEWEKFHLDRGGFEDSKGKIKHLMIEM